MNRTARPLPAPAWWLAIVRAHCAAPGRSKAKLARDVGCSQPYIVKLLADGAGDQTSRYVLAIAHALDISPPPEARILDVVERLTRTNPAAIDRAIAYLEGIAIAEKILGADGDDDA